MRERIDTELLAVARDGNKDAFGYLVERYRPMTERIAQGMVGNAYIAQELAQEAMLQAYLSLDRLRNDGRFASWLYGITLNVCRNHLRSQKMDVSSLEAYSVVVLHDEAHHRALGLYIGQAEAFAIDRGLRQSPLPRPMTVNFIASILHSLGAVLEEVRIESLKDEIFYATARIRRDNTLHEIDARPSDAIALAIATSTPIFVSDEVFSIAGVALPEGKTLHRLEANTAVEGPGQHSGSEELVLKEELTKPESCEGNLQHVLQILML